MLAHSKQNHFRSSLHHGSTEHIEGKVDVRLSSKFQPLTFASPLSSRSHPVSQPAKPSTKNNRRKDQHRVCPLRESLHVRSCLALPWFTSSLCGFQSSADPAKCAAFPALLLVIWTRKQWRRWPSHAHKVTVARLQARHQCCSTSPRHFLSFPPGGRARQGKGAGSALRVLVWCAPPPWRQ